MREEELEDIHKPPLSPAAAILETDRQLHSELALMDSCYAWTRRKCWGCLRMSATSSVRVIKALSHQ